MNAEPKTQKRTTARRKDPACGTCRKKCRKCDRTRPICNRCRIKGLHCEGYPPRFEFLDMIPAKLQGKPRPESSQNNEGRGSPAEPEGPPAAETVDDGWRVEAGEPVAPDSTATLALSPPDGSITLNPSNPLAVSPRHIVDGNSPAVFSSPAASHSSPCTFFSETYARLDQEDLVGHRPLISHFECHLVNSITLPTKGLANPFCEHILPLAYQHDGVLHALLGLSACHMHFSGRDESQECFRTALRHRLAAIRALGSLLLKEETSKLSSAEEEAVLAMVLLLVFHDICETGVSSHGAHLTGVSFLCRRLANQSNPSTRPKATIFFVSALAWLDLLRGFSGAEKLAYPDEVREYVRDHASRAFHSFVGCPPVIFFRIGQVLQSGKAFLAGTLSLADFQQILRSAENFFRGWDPEQATYPTEDPEWGQLAEAFRHACLLRILRFPDAFAVSCTDPAIQASVSAILDVCAKMPRDSVFYKRLLFPLFLAGADTSSAHQMHYAGWCVNEIKHSTGFQHSAMTDMLTRVWEQRQSNSYGWVNVPWMEFTCSEQLESQHAYLFF